MFIYKLANAAASKITVTTTATILLDLIATAGSAAHGLPGLINSLDIFLEDGDIRILFDGNTPTGTNGVLLKSGGFYSFRGVPLTKLKLIRVTGDVVCSIQVGTSDPGEGSSSSAPGGGSGGAASAAGSASLTSNYRATSNGNGDGTAIYLSATTLTIAGTPFTIQNEDLVYIREVDATGNTATLWVNGSDSVHMEISGGVLTRSGGDDFSANGVYEVGYNGQDKGYIEASQSKRTSESKPLSEHFGNNVINVDTTNVAVDTHYYPSPTGALMDGRRDLSLSGKLIDANGTLTLTVEMTNDEDATNADWIQVYGRDDKNDDNVNEITVTNGTVTFALSFNNANFKRYRSALVASGNTNTVIIKGRNKAL